MPLAGLIAFGALRAACQEQTTPTGYTYGCETDNTAASVLEWVITACFGLYILSFVSQASGCVARHACVTCICC